MLRVLLPMVALMLFLMPAPARAIPTCALGTMADYIALGADGCQFDFHLDPEHTYTRTYSNFSYVGSVRAFTGVPSFENAFGIPVDPPPPHPRSP